MRTRTKIHMQEIGKGIKSMVLENFFSVLLGVVLIAGVVIGTRTASVPFEGELIFSGNFKEIFISSFLSMFWYHMIIIAFGLSLVFFGAPIVLFIRGLGIGAMLIAIYDVLGYTISRWSLLILIPYFTVIALMMLVSTKLSVTASYQLIQGIRAKRSADDIRRTYQKFAVQNVLMLVAVALVSLIYTLLVMFMQPILIL